MSDLLTPTVFLDIDGVLNSGKNYHEWNAAHDEGYKSRMEAGLDTDRWATPSEDPYILKLFDKDNIAVLNEITSQSGARIVISSSWRMFYARNFQKLRDVLAAAGVQAEVVGPTPTSVPQRGLAIESWILQNCAGKALPCVILDDEGQHSFTDSTERWLVRTDGSTGLVPKDVARALKILKGRKVTL